MFVLFAWVNQDQGDASFEDRVPLLFLAHSVRSHASTERFCVLFLDGYDRLSSRYLSQLRALGFDAVDFCDELRWLARPFQHLEQFRRSEVLCFLRWLALEHYLRKEGIREHVIHVDADVFFNALPEEIAKDVEGLTFVLQGCPAFVSIASHNWFECYLEELRRFNRDIEDYSSAAWQQRPGWEQSYREKWAGHRDRRIISSDQDLISHLIHTDRIVQNSPLRFVKRLRLYYAENPLYFHDHAGIQLSKDQGLFFSSDGERCHVDGRKVAFWHFQSAFSEYLNAAIVLRSVHYRFRFPNHLESGGFGLLLSRLARKAAMSRRHIYGSLKELNPDNPNIRLSFAEIFNRRAFWKKGVFSNPP
jgi:hypothetical protein